MRVSLSAIKYIAGTGPAGPAGQPGPTLPALEAGRHCQCWSTRAPALLPGERLVGGIATRKFQAIRSPARVTGVEAIRARSDSQEQDSDSARIAGSSPARYGPAHRRPVTAWYRIRCLPLQFCRVRARGAVRRSETFMIPIASCLRGTILAPIPARLPRFPMPALFTASGPASRALFAADDKVCSG
jgi:hypothetical protein